jgi:tRNA (guanine-N7-)-methyltransferase
MAKRHLTNVRLARADARMFLRDFVASDSCQAIHIYFPDPWWKKRHLKRRVFTPEFAFQCERILQPGGRLYLATDVAEYFDVMTRLVADHTHLREDRAENAAQAAPESDYLTNFERKARLQGMTIYRACYRRSDVTCNSSSA